MGYNVIVLYHRAPFKKTKENGKELYSEKVKPNGVMPTIKSFLSSVHAGTWICWEESDNISYGYRTMQYMDYTLKLVPVKAHEANQFYNQTSKEGFWPVLHSFTEKFNYNSVDWNNFLDINRRFANAAIDCADEDSIIWIHDYNLWMSPWFIREKLPTIKIAFFHHTPFPSPDIFNMLPWREEIVKSLLCCDLCCFNIPRYVENFVMTAKSLVDIESITSAPVNSIFSGKGALYEPTMSREIVYNGHKIYMDAVPEGTDHCRISELLDNNSSNGLSGKIKQITSGRKVIFSASRIDYIKGTAQMLQAFEALLQDKPGLRDEIVLCLISVAAPEGMVAYSETQKEIEHLTGRINGRFSSADYTPVIFFTENISFDEMIIWYANADVLVIPSLRDGMNLICKEYIAVRGGSTGALVLSEFAGAAVELEGAILANPYSRQSLVDALKQAIDMDQQESRDRMRRLYEIVRSSNVITWAKQLDNLKAGIYDPDAINLNIS